MSYRFSFAVACAAGVLAQPFSLAFSQSSTVPTAQTADTLQETQVTATRESTAVSRALADVTVIRAADLAKLASRSLPEVLANVAGLEIATNGGLGSTTGLFTRGTNSNHTLVLIDGMRFGSATAGNPALENIPLALIDRIEIVRGPMSSLYGSDALGGVIQIFTKTGQGSTRGLIPNASFSLGSQGYGQLSLGIAGATSIDGASSQGWDFALQVQRTQTNGFSATNPNALFNSYHPDKDGFAQDSVSAKLGYRFNKDWAVRFSAFESNAKTQLDLGFDPNNPGLVDRGRIRAQNLSLQLDGKFTPIWSSALSLGQSKDVSRITESVDPFNLSRFATEQQQIAWTNRLKLSHGVLSGGIEHLKQNVSLQDAFGNPNFKPSERTIQSLWLAWQAEYGAWSVQSSLRRDRNSQFGGNTTGNLALGYRLNQTWALHGSFGSAFAAPSFNNLYYPGFSNPALQPENSRSVEAGLRYQGNWSSRADGRSDFKVVLFQQKIRDLIVSDPTTYLPVNLNEARILGLSLQARHRAGPWTLSGNLDLSDPVNASPGAQNGALLPRRARTNLRASGDYDFGTWQAGASLRFASSRFDDPSNARPLAAYSLLDLRARWQVAPEWELGLNLNNAFDKRYETAYGYNQAGRLVFISVSYRGK